jgi:hypothetical protein
MSRERKTGQQYAGYKLAEDVRYSAAPPSASMAG